MRDSFPAVDRALHDAVLVDSNCGQHVECVFIAGIDAIKNQGANNLLPGRATLVPEFRLLQIHNISNVLHDTVQRTRRQNFVFVVICDGDQKLGVSVIHSRSQVVTVAQSELVGVTGGRSICIWSAPLYQSLI